MTNAISNLDDTIDSRDVIARIEELEDKFNEYNEDMIEAAHVEGRKIPDPLTIEDWADLFEEGEELQELKVLAAQGEDYAPDWKYGALLIHEDYFETAMDEMLEDCGDIPRDLPSWMTITYDYDALKMDYTTIDFDGQTYYIR